MKRLSLQWRITLLTALLIACACVCMNLLLYRTGVTGMDALNGFMMQYQPGSAAPLTIEIPQEEMSSLLAHFSQEVYDAKVVFGRKGWCITAAVTLLSAAIAYFVSGKALEPLKKLAQQAERIDQDSLVEVRLEENTIPEFRDLSQSVNRMLDRLAHSFDLQRQFAGNAAHELKTPLTSMKVLADSLNGQEDVPVELYREFMLDIGNEIERENKIINDLLSLVKMDKSASDLNITSVNINEMLDLILKRLKPIAEKQHVDLVLESFRPVTAEIDEVKLTLAITNLVENAIKYNKEDGWVHVSLNADYQYFYLKVEDSGIGIPEDSLEHIYERFYRVDKSHSREIGGTGLGLAITRNAILMHRGAIKVFSTEGEGTLFTVRIPLNYIA